MKKNNKGFSIVIAMGLVIFINLIAIGIIDYIIPFSKSTRNIENSIVAYYQANSAIEDALYYLKENNYDAGTQGNIDFSGSIVDNKYNIIALGNEIPASGEGNSEYDLDWNQIAMGNPIQLEIGGINYFFDDFEIAFRVPDLNGNGNLNLDGDSDSIIINWQISSESNTLNSNSSYVLLENICEAGDDFEDCVLDFSSKDGIDLTGTKDTIGDFYSDNCSASSDECILKLSVVNNLKIDNNNEIINIPYLEYRIKTVVDFPLRYSTIETSGKAYGYSKNLEIQIPQQTTNEAFDFTVFQ